MMSKAFTSERKPTADTYARLSWRTNWQHRMEQQDLFPTPLWSTHCLDSQLLQGAANTVLNIMAADPVGVRLTNQGAWHSQTTLLQEPKLADLFNWIASEIKKALDTWGWDAEMARPKFNNAWAIVSRAGGRHGAHIHPNSLFSGVLYLAAPAGSGSIAFLDPRAGALMLQPPLTRGAYHRECGRHCCVPEQGLMLLFPSWLWHEVEASSCTDPRICISFNLGLNPIKAQ